MIQWGQPLWLIALAAPLLLVLFELLGKRTRERLRARFASLPLWDRLAVARSSALRRTRRYLFAAALVFLVVGLANPRVGTRFEEVKREGIDIVLAVDVSRSMDSQDIRPSRLTKAKYELAKFIQGMKGDRVGIVPFAGTAYPLLPMTLDYAAAKMFLDLLATDLIPTPGTNIEDAIDKALAEFPVDDEEKGRARAIVLVSDGEDHEGGAERAAEKAEKAGVPIYTIGMALAKGDPIPVYDDQGNRTGWLTDDDGNVVTSRLNEDLLRSLARKSGGSYRRADQGGEAFRSLYNELFKLDRKEFESRRITGFEDRFQPLLAMALLLLVLQFLLPAGLPRRRAMKKRDLTALLLPLALVLGVSTARAENPHELVKQGNKDVVEKNLDDALTKYLEAKAKVDSSRPEIDYNLGGVYARKGDLARADSLYNSLPPDARKQLRARAAYNKGTAYADAQQFDKAVPNFIDALRLDPDDMDAKMNLELALRKMQEQKQQQQGDQNQQDQDKKQNQQNQQDKQDQKDQQDQQQKQKDQEKKDQQQQQQAQQQKMDKELAERLLDQLQQDEKQLLKQVVRQQIPQKSKGTGKPW